MFQVKSNVDLRFRDLNHQLLTPESLYSVTKGAGLVVSRESGHWTNESKTWITEHG